MKRAMPRAAVLVALILLAGCTGDTAGPAGQGAATAAASTPPSILPSSAPTVAPSPTPDVAMLFEEAYARLTTGSLSMVGTVTMGSTTAPVSGEMKFDGADSVSTTTSTVGDRTATSVDAYVAGVRYRQTPDGLWFVDVRSHGPDLSAELTRIARHVTVKSMRAQDGQPLYTLAPAQGVSLLPSALGFSAAATGITSAIEFYADADGTPRGISIALTWRQPSGTATVECSATLGLRFSDLGSAIDISPPSPIWTTYDSTAYGYRMAYPDILQQTTQNDVDYFVRADGGYVGVGRDATRGNGLSAIVASEIAMLKSNYKTPSVANEATKLGGVSARMLTTSGTLPSDKRKVVVYEIVAVKGKYVYFVFLTAPQGSEANDLAMFKLMVGTFGFR